MCGVCVCVWGGGVFRNIDSYGYTCTFSDQGNAQTNTSWTSLLAKNTKRKNCVFED